MARITSQTQPLAVILLAAGLSQRTGDVNKLLHPYQGTALLCHGLARLKQAGSFPIFVITGHQHKAIEDALSDQEVSFIYNQNYHTGMASSIRTALRELSHFYENVMISLADTPHLDSAIIAQLVKAHLTHKTPNRLITRPLYDGKMGHPVIWGKDYFPVLQKLDGDHGGKALFETAREHTQILAFSNPNPARDFDTLADFL